jgi:hypothetical protein
MVNYADDEDDEAVHFAICNSLHKLTLIIKFHFIFLEEEAG